MKFIKELFQNYFKEKWGRGFWGKVFLVWEVTYIALWFPLVIVLEVFSKEPISKFRLITWMALAWLFVVVGFAKDLVYKWEIDKYKTKADEIIYGAVKGILEEIGKRAGFVVGAEKIEVKEKNEKFN